MPRCWLVSFHIARHCNRMLTAGGDTFTWDDNGNMTSKTSGGVTTNYTYSYEDQLKELTKGTDTYQYTYNADGLRTKQVKNGVTTNFTWDMSKEIPEVITAGNTNYLYGLDLISSGQAGVITFYYQDGLGSNKILADGNGNVTANYYYKAFGNILSQSGAGTTSLKFAGEQNDVTGLIYLRATDCRCVYLERHPSARRGEGCPGLWIYEGTDSSPSAEGSE